MGIASMPNKPHLHGDPGGREASGASAATEWWEVELLLLLGEIELVQIELRAPDAIPPPARPGGHNTPRLR